MVFQEENLSAMNTDPWYSAYHYSHPPLVERLAALDEPDKKEDWVGNLWIGTELPLHVWISSVLRTWYFGTLVFCELSFTGCTPSLGFREQQKAGCHVMSANASICFLT